MMRMKQHILSLLSLAMLCLQSASADSWQIIPSPNGSRQVNELHSVSALAENDVWAAGVSYNTERTSGSILIEHWNGSQWSVVPSPNPSAFVNKINAIAAVSANDVWAVGTAPTPTDTVLILHWNGAAWSVVPNPSNGIPLTNLAALAVISANDIWAVGSDLQAASAVASNDVWATGYSELGTLAEHWDGSSWSLVQTASGGRLDPLFLPGVVALASNNVWSVGEALQAGHLSRTLTEQWNGTSWVMVQSPNLGADHNELFTVDATRGGTLWAVGTVYHFPL